MKPMKGLSLNCVETAISDAPAPSEVLIPLRGYDGKGKLKIKEEDSVVTGQQLMPGVFSTVTGKVSRIQPLLTADGEFTALRIEVSGKEENHPDIKKDPDYLAAAPAELLEKLNRANLGFREELGSIDTVVVSAVDTDPLHAVYHQVLRENKDQVIEGLKLIKHLTSAKQVVLVVPEPLYNLVSEAAGTGISVHAVKPVYPNGLPEILLKQLANRYPLNNHLFLRVEKLAAAVNALREGKPFVHKVVTVIDGEKIENYRVPIGTPVAELLKEHHLKSGDKLIIGGSLRGFACFDMDIPIDENMDSIYIQDAREVIDSPNHPCMSCGRCVKACPVDLDVNLICRYSEFSIFEKCVEMEIDDCIECGLCAYNCPSGRSLVQFIRLAKAEAQRLEEDVEGEKVA
jgi:electron transport complex protein RnfC